MQADRDALLRALSEAPVEDLVRMAQKSATALQQAVRTEMLARGEATERVEQTATHSVGQAPQNMRQRMLAMMADPDAQEQAKVLAERMLGMAEDE